MAQVRVGSDVLVWFGLVWSGSEGKVWCETTTDTPVEKTLIWCEGSLAFTCWKSELLAERGE